ncbi:MAG: hypothetical protein ACR2J9_03265 [Gaiellales bacterium]
MQRRLRFIPVLVLIAFAAGLAACGGSDLASDPGKVLASAKLPPAGPNASTFSAEFVPAADATSPGADSGALGGIAGLLGGPITIEATTQGDAATGLTADAKITAGPLDVPVSVRENADDTWVQVGGTWYALGQPLGVDFGAIGKQLGNVSKLIRDPKAVAVEKVGDVECDRISGKLDPGADLTDQLGNLAENLPIDLGALAKGDADVSVWVGRSDGLIHRVQLSTAPSGDVAKSGGLTVDLSVVAADPVTVEAPADAKPITDLLTGALGNGSGLGDLGGLLGGLDLGKLLGGNGLGDLLGGATTGSNA